MCLALALCMHSYIDSRHDELCRCPLCNYEPKYDDSDLIAEAERIELAANDTAAWQQMVSVYLRGA